MRLGAAMVVLSLLCLFGEGWAATEIFDHGEVDWDQRLALVRGDVPVQGDRSPSARLRCRRAARIALFANAFRLSCEIRGVDIPESFNIGEGLFEDVTILGGERDGLYSVWAWFPLDRLMELSVSPR